MTTHMTRFARMLRPALALLLVVVVPNVTVLADRNRGNVRSSSRSTVNRNVNQNTNVNRNRNVNRNIDVDRDIDVDVDVDHHYGGCCYHSGWGTAAAVASTAGVTAARVGSRVNTLPPSCTVVIVNGFTYQQCGTVRYQPQLSGSSTTYVVVNAPR
jgi:hypothetical protein